MKKKSNPKNKTKFKKKNISQKNKRNFKNKIIFSGKSAEIMKNFCNDY